MTQFTSLAPFIPSGPDLEQSKLFFIALGFEIKWDNGDYIGFKRDNCEFILQNFNDRPFAENLMMRIIVDDLDLFWKDLSAKQLDKKFKVKFKEPTQQPWGREVTIIDIAGVCWHVRGTR
jgi:hypothetical protein